ncbi:hypothetical protein [Endozoicomonas lisbonensis]|uniref:Uncharacterized protein n=1 Tax=Endozoicomonas lisbonensis TaxID=3120522 RepID=A0ABV2SGW0_9GAMM
MSAIRYYRCDNPEILSVFDQVQDERSQLQKKGAELAEAVTAITGEPCKVMFNANLHEWTVAGVRFEKFTKALQADFCKPMKSGSFITRPKVKADPEIKELFKDLPIVDRNKCWEALGTDWGNLLFTPIGYAHKKGEFLYIECSLDLTERLTEITGGEYQQIEKQTQ